MHGNYVILFRILDEIVRIERIAYGGRNLPNVYDEAGLGVVYSHCCYQNSM